MGRIDRVIKYFKASGKYAEPELGKFRLLLSEEDNIITEIRQARAVQDHLKVNRLVKDLIAVQIQIPHP